MSRAAEAGSLGSWVQQLLDSLAAFKSRNTSIRIKGINGNGKSRLMVVRVVHHHLADVQLIKTLAVNRSTDEPLGVFRHEVHVLRGHGSGRHNQVAFVLPVLIIHHYHHLAMLDVLDGLFHCGKFILKVTHISNPFQVLLIHSLKSVLQQELPG